MQGPVPSIHSGPTSSTNDTLWSYQADPSVSSSPNVPEQVNSAICYAMPGTAKRKLLIARYAMPGTDRGHAATRSPVLSCAMLLQMCYAMPGTACTELSYAPTSCGCRTVRKSCVGQYQGRVCA
eukprot:928826-Rhodomonas_salina.1